MKNKFLIIFIGIMLAFTVFYVLYYAGIISFETVADLENEESIEVISIDDLENDKFYIWHDMQNSLEDDLAGTSDPSVFTICPEGTINWKKNKSVGRTIWFSSSEDSQIPTLYPGDALIYVSQTSVPGESSSAIENGNINWERFADYGYSIGVTNLAADKSGHYYIEYNSDTGFAGFINDLTDAKDVADFKNFIGSRIYLDRVGNIDIREGLVSDGGTILNLNKDSEYLCKWYKGSYVSDFKLTASVHVFSSMESFKTVEWDFVSNDSNLTHIRSCITITIPEEFKSGYYYISNIGFFRYVSMKDISLYNGNPYDQAVNWNDPIILHDEHGQVMYNPFLGIDERSRLGAGTSQSNGVKVENPYNERKEDNYNSDFEIVDDPYENQSDGGAEEYEIFEDEIYYEDDEEYDDLWEEEYYGEEMEGYTDT